MYVCFTSLGNSGMTRSSRSRTWRYATFISVLERNRMEIQHPRLWL
jgi:hypothetical protein